MPAPDNTPIEMYNVMKRCWSYESESRPHFDEIATDVERILTSMKD
jgi:tyrosine-protein kinase Fer